MTYKLYSVYFDLDEDRGDYGFSVYIIGADDEADAREIAQHVKFDFDKADTMKVKALQATTPIRGCLDVYGWRD